MNLAWDSWEFWETDDDDDDDDDDDTGTGLRLVSSSHMMIIGFFLCGEKKLCVLNVLVDDSRVMPPKVTGATGVVDFFFLPMI